MSTIPVRVHEAKLFSPFLCKSKKKWECFIKSKKETWVFHFILTKTLLFIWQFYYCMVYQNAIHNDLMVFFIKIFVKKLKNYANIWCFYYRHNHCYLHFRDIYVTYFYLINSLWLHYMSLCHVIIFDRKLKFIWLQLQKLIILDICHYFL